MMEMKDIVYGQSPHGRNEEIRKASMEVRRRGEKDGQILIEIRGSFDLRDRTHQFRPTVYGQAAFDPEAGRFTAFEAFAAGPRKGGTTYNFRRNRDPGPAPLGISLVMEDGQH